MMVYGNTMIILKYTIGLKCMYYGILKSTKKYHGINMFLSIVLCIVMQFCLIY